MLTMTQRVVAIATIGFLNLVTFLFTGLLVVISLVVSIPLALAILRL